MKLFHTSLLFITCFTSLCFSMQDKPQEKKCASQELDQIFLKKRLQLEQAVQIGGKAAITELGLSIHTFNASRFTLRTKKALVKSKIISKHGKIFDLEYLKMVYEDELLIAEIQGISRK